jgi:hypothetical protein
MAMTAFLCLFAGIFLGLHFRAFVVAPMTLAIATGMAILAATAGGALVDTLLVMLTAVLGIQFGYLLGVVVRGLVSAGTTRSRHTASAPAQRTV